VPSQCFLCEDDDADPVAVGQDFDLSSSPETFLAVRCRRCGLVYLNPAPTVNQVEHPPSPGGALGREIARFRHRLGDSARVLDVRGIEDLDNASGAYDGVLLSSVLERVNDPLSALKATRELLRPGGTAFVATPNTEGTVSQVFRGRHWSGYNFPRHRNLFCADVLRQASEKAGLERVSVRTVGAPDAWVRSVRNTMSDWRLPHWSLAGLRGIAFLGGTAIEWWQRLRGKGGILVASLRRPVQ
jgi:SAM-dependent methyltransferase